MNPFKGQNLTPGGPASDMVPVVASDVTDLATYAVALYVETGGALSVLTVAGGTRTVQVADFSILPLGVRRVNATGTTASGIHAMVLA